MKRSIALFISLLFLAENLFSECVIVDTQYSHPVTDFTGKTVFTRRTITKKCTKNSQMQIGCNKWKTINTNGSLDYNITDIETIFKQQDGSDAAGQTMAMLNDQFHLFSGWDGYCDQGTLWSNPFSDPMALLSYTMIVYGAASKAGQILNSGDPTAVSELNAAQKAVGEAYNSISDTFNNAYGAVKDAVGVAQSSTPEDVLSAMNSGQESYLSAYETITNTSGTGLISNFQKMNEISSATVSFGSIGNYALVMKFYYTDILQLGMSLMPTEKEMKSANDFNMAWLGDETTDQRSVAYANCMASIGLSYPNLISSYAGDVNSTSDELKNVFENPLVLTYEQFAQLISSTDFLKVTNTGELPPLNNVDDFLKGGFVDSMYMVLEDDPDQERVVLIARSGIAYTTAGKAICAGKLAKAQSVLTPPIPKNDSGSGIGKAVGMMAAKKVLAMLPFPYNLAATIILDILTSIDSVDGCRDKEDAMKMGMIQLKTNNFLNFDQCYHRKTTCQNKFLGSCILHRHHYCCYDQISTRIFAEGVKEELDLPFDECNNIELEDLQRISFVKCPLNTDPNLDIDKDGEMDKYVEANTSHCFPGKKWDELEEAVTASGVVNFNFKNAANQAINSLAIPHSVCNH